jgi:FMN reductase
MSSIVVLSGSPSVASRTAALADHVAHRLIGQNHQVRSFRVRDLPPAALLTAAATDPAIAEVTGAITDADGLVVASPVYKASFSGLLKALLDLLPPSALAGKVVLPLLTGGSHAHVLAIDYALRPVLSSLGAGHIVQGWFVLDQHIEPVPGGARLDPAAVEPVHGVVDTFGAALRQVTVEHAA